MVLQLRSRTRVQPTSTSSSCAPRCAGFFVLLLGASQEVTKKDARTFPPGPPFALPLYKENRGEKHENFKYISRHTATTSGR